MLYCSSYSTESEQIELRLRAKTLGSCHNSSRHLGLTLADLRSDRTGLRSFTAVGGVRGENTGIFMNFHNISRCLLCITNFKLLKIQHVTMPVPTGNASYGANLAMSRLPYFIKDNMIQNNAISSIVPRGKFVLLCKSSQHIQCHQKVDL